MIQATERVMAAETRGYGNNLRARLGPGKAFALKTALTLGV